MPQTANAKSRRYQEPEAHRHFTALELAFFRGEVSPLDECDEPFIGWGERLHMAICDRIERLRAWLRDIPQLA